MKLALLLATGATLLAFAGAGNGSHCNGNVTAIGPLYVDDRDITTEGGLWVYLESNDQPGLQSGGIGALDPIGQTTGLFGSADSCVHPNPDTLIF